MSATPLTDAEPVYCSGCKNEIDPALCICGDSIHHSPWELGHMPVPMGCVCGYPDENK